MIEINLALSVEDIEIIQCLQNSEDKKIANFAGKILDTIQTEIKQTEINHHAILNLLEEQR